MICPLCYSRYGTGYPQRIPRDLDCRHTFCTGKKNTYALALLEYIFNMMTVLKDDRSPKSYKDLVNFSCKPENVYVVY